MTHNPNSPNAHIAADGARDALDAQAEKDAMWKKINDDRRAVRERQSKSYEGVHYDMTDDERRGA